MNNRSLRALLLGLTVLLVSCDGDTTVGLNNQSRNHIPVNPLSNNPFELHLGETTFLEPENLEVTFDAVLHDSRCPSDVVCFWEGMATIELRIIDLPDTHFVTVSIFGGDPQYGTPFPSPLDTLGLRLTLLALDPYPVSIVQTPDSTFLATLSVFRHPPLDSVDGEVVITNMSPGNIVLDQFRLNKVQIDGDVITLDIQFAGGCEEHEFELFMSPAEFLESRPVQADLYLRHDGNGDACEALLQRSVAFDLRPVAHQHQILYGYVECIALNVHHYPENDSTIEAVTVIYMPHDARPTAWCNRRFPTAGLSTDAP